MTDARTLAVYAARAEAYSAIHHGQVAQDRLAAFIARLPKGGAALDLGCGPGWAAAEMAAAGLRVTALDACPEMAAAARARYGIKVEVAGFADLAAEAAFDGIWAHFSLLHAPRAALPAHLAAIARALRPGGVFAVAMKQGQGEARDRIGRLYTYVAPADFRGEVTRAGLTVEAEETEPGTGFDGSPFASLYLLARRAA
ncbi:class I SAM-dependent methyltransferase [Rhodovulum kholense]|uniref:Methyltransferase family protein n=1 Tax=Rhodovulum kholense TaxID=453584 RepID=A0A8E3ASX3_9RHOB|nr:class I SAM-dependent methyltransferase [Rhodovulum kholense]PTW51531.1 methyltransferase family protein [Rhodovulum kholense]